MKVLKPFNSLLLLSLVTFTYRLSRTEEGKVFLSRKKIQTSDIFKYIYIQIIHCKFTSNFIKNHPHGIVYCDSLYDSKIPVGGRK